MLFDSLAFEEGNHLVKSQLLLLTAAHVFQGDLFLLDLRIANQCYERNVQTICVSHLLLHLHRIRVEFRIDPTISQPAKQGENIFHFTLAEIHKEQLGLFLPCSRKIICLQEIIIDPVCAEAYPNT